KTVYAISSFTGSTPDEVLATIPAYLFADAPVASRDATKDGNYNIDLDAIKAAATPADTATDGDVK
ncbi:MAG: hypothetical protein IKZ30_04430, partial [Oscillospiraceae bacterium]|nr:hypothetical protein [Oscillospiraceae bacterium]